MNKSPPLSSKFRINASGHLIPLLTKKWRVKLSSESVRHVQLLFLWDGRVASDTLIVVSWQLHNISWQHVVVSRFYIIYCQSKTVHRRFSFPRVAFCVDFVGLYWTFLVVRHGKSFRCNGSYIPWIVSWTSFGFSFIEFEVLLPCGSFDKVLRLSLNTFLCASCSLVYQNGLCCWTIPCFSFQYWVIKKTIGRLGRRVNFLRMGLRIFSSKCCFMVSTSIKKLQSAEHKRQSPLFVRCCL